MGVRSTSQEINRETKERRSHSSSSSTSLVTSLMKSWRISSSSSSSSSSKPSNKSSQSFSGNPTTGTYNDTMNNNLTQTNDGHSNQLRSSNEHRLYSLSRTNSSDGNFDAMSKQQNSTTKSITSPAKTYSPLRYASPSSNQIESPRASLLRQQHNKHSHHNQIYYQHNNNSTISEHSTHKKSSDKYFEDLDEDWSAVIDNYNMPIPMLTNGGNGKSSTSNNNNQQHNDPRNNLSRTSTASSVATSITSTTMTQGQSLQYPQLPNLNTMEAIELEKSQEEIENEREVQELNSIMQRITKFDNIIKGKNVINLQELRQLSWNGIPKPHRPIVWKLLIGYLPANTRRQESLLKRKRQEYTEGLKHTFSDEHSRDIPTWHQIEIDIPRTNPHIPLYQFKSVHDSLQRILYLWAIRHPASGYVQGINDLVTPFFQTFLTEYLPPSKIDTVEVVDPDTYLTEDQKENLEADTFWCLTKFLEQITDNYIHGQPGILKQVKNLGQLVKRIDFDLYKHFQNEHVEFIQFAFRWMNCLLMREFQMDTVIRMWDTYLAETSPETTSSFATSNQSNSSNDGVLSPHTPVSRKPPTFGTPNIDLASPASSASRSNMTTQTNASPAGVSSSDDSSNRFSHTSLNEFHVFVCAAFLIKWSDMLCDMDFQGIITFLQNPPTKDWTETDIEMLLSEAYIWQSLYKDATSHWLK
ncbi:similar to Saccharomyces cerevisiae YOR070C GYP1 Cis-golgi GTPase-activating protein (GAP) for the Rab family members Ypt1p (in vivo) and for Ypt1p, Sec4p, Ypt7p, and Ypt51p (in vitro) [Maudiozyma barnettii]|uniref:Similar to Saccharomyces cerevisiae YOR070C GYP1 Cis-golgi GTPase-activating protein (GAP) for the Rab family members Ypt1p (In vivo) and for Ypt1p, Sec4p, Ypt7p, and Ypt51p (In vitro) n=1 Tax=Maudiozyma barnettii TaxID=61262 RepID=A0A8H2ZLM5_9SACH|nr:GTPase-activating protein GYP1 [Kazachstania barnettii]CAB4256267.1 similar to Saccharomyces cerevisiae YOR070C GYP1 Cis-golgi GTPase-activating protein (GAP) for the Rab family members Ypt1p (in vivo) and for Ypt1p, Sec4p, Ypt7p, and Ypt51p (in vitro) [Kazachstania barnettii]CAD1784876.1 similar to Saccharomyces cerevisiae YOR070C GYP1 Cis-golgi GTPase-activating protein (GAP) for the Rab family members Ypt1p (in vivo) and for Ypt1p, Sec4p, Ypt7p, and Ypt51p (in vitro) [Kazachstania barnettii